MSETRFAYILGVVMGFILALSCVPLAKALGWL